MTTLPSDLVSAGGHDHATAERIARLTAFSRRLRSELLGLRDESAVYDCACRAATEIGQFRFAWVGLPDSEVERFVPVTSAGVGDGYLEAVVVALGEGAAARGPTNAAYLEGVTVVCADIATDPRMTPWREQALARGFRSSGAFPFHRKGVVAGTLNVYSPELGFADPLEQYLLEGVAEDIGVALEAIAQERGRQLAEARLEASERRHRVVFENASDGLFVANAEHLYIDANPAGLAMLGYTHDELTKLRLDEVIAATDLTRKPVDLASVPANRSFVTERRLVRKDGAHVDVEIHGVKLEDGTLLSVVRDVAERNRSLAERAVTDRMTSLGRLAQGVGHEINNPLAYLSLSLEDLRESVGLVAADVRPDIEASLSKAEDGARRIAAIVKSLAAFGRGDSAAVGSVSLDQPIQAAVALTANRLSAVAEVVVRIEATQTARANEFQLTQVLVNLLLNACDAMEEAPRKDHRVTIVARDGAGELLIDVVDTGPGIPPAIREHVFDPFFTTKPIGRGTGLGLAICRGIMESFNGCLELVGSQPGAAFRLRLGVGERVVAAPPNEQRAASLNALNILIVDDEILIAKIIARLLKGHRVTLVHDLEAAHELCRREEYDRILCDLMFPGGSSEPFFDALVKERPELARRVIFMTGGAFTPSAQSFLERTGRPRLTKPFTIGDLREALNEPPAP